MSLKPKIKNAYLVFFDFNLIRLFEILSKKFSFKLETTNLIQSIKLTEKEFLKEATLALKSSINVSFVSVIFLLLPTNLKSNLKFKIRMHKGY